MEKTSSQLFDENYRNENAGKPSLYWQAFSVMFELTPFIAFFILIAYVAAILISAGYAIFSGGQPIAPPADPACFIICINGW
jgi:hypothetical protein